MGAGALGARGAARIARWDKAAPRLNPDRSLLREPGRPVVVEEVELDPPKGDEVLVRVAAAGVCHSDVRLADGELGNGRWPMVLGHEGAGIVEAVGAEVAHVRPGDHVAFSFVPACGRCRFCASGQPNLCEPAGRSALAGVLLDGTSRLHANGDTLQHGLMTACFAERTVVAAAGALKIPAELPLPKSGERGFRLRLMCSMNRAWAHSAGDSR